MALLCPTIDRVDWTNEDITAEESDEKDAKKELNGSLQYLATGCHPGDILRRKNRYQFRNLKHLAFVRDFKDRDYKDFQGNASFITNRIELTVTPPRIADSQDEEPIGHMSMPKTVLLDTRLRVSSIPIDW